MPSPSNLVLDNLAIPEATTTAGGGVYLGHDAHRVYFTDLLGVCHYCLTASLSAFVMDEVLWPISILTAYHNSAFATNRKPDESKLQPKNAATIGTSPVTQSSGAFEFPLFDLACGFVLGDSDLDHACAASRLRTRRSPSASAQHHQPAAPGWRSCSIHRPSLLPQLAESLAILPCGHHRAARRQKRFGAVASYVATAPWQSCWWPFRSGTNRREKVGLFQQVSRT